MLIESKSRYYLKKVRAKAKMWEYHIPEESHPKTEAQVRELLILAIGIIGDCSDRIIQNPDITAIELATNLGELRFAASFFDSYVQSGLHHDKDDYFLILGSTVCYMAGLNGSSLVLAQNISSTVDLGVNKLDLVLTQVLAGNDEICISGENEEISPLIDEVHSLLKRNVADGFPAITQLRDSIYLEGSDRELLFIDCLLAVLYLKKNNSAYSLLPTYSGLDSSIWFEPLQHNTIIREMWPAQRALGEKGVYAGKSATIQLPTGAGKTKSVALIILSAFLSRRTDTAVIVAPFRALCREISEDLEKAFSFDAKIHVNELSDTLQMDIDDPFASEEDTKKIFVATPEKLLYILRQDTSVIQNVGLFVFDEGHLFDDYSRGITYELLISTIKHHIGDEVQKILISAVIANSEEINGWLTDNNGVVITNNAIQSADKSIAFSELYTIDDKVTSYLRFVDPQNPEEEEFYVPRVFSQIPLLKKKREIKDRFFPDTTGKVNHNDIAIAYALQLSGNGGVAVFCGRKDSADKILDRFMELENRGIDISAVANSCEQEELKKIHYLIKGNLGEAALHAKAAEKGLFAHHSGLPASVRSSEEYAMQKGYIKFIACTSTLAQGVNLPIRYLVVSSIYQGKDRISVRDFQNLIGRAGRSGMYTEGTIILTEAGVYINRKNPSANWKWNNYKELLNPQNTEACSSILLSSIRTEPQLSAVLDSIIDVFEAYYYQDRFQEMVDKLMVSLDDSTAEWAKITIKRIIRTIEAIEGFLMFYLVEKTYEASKADIHDIMAETLAFRLASSGEMKRLIRVVDLVGVNLVALVDTPDKRYRYSKSLMSVGREIEIDQWVRTNGKVLADCMEHNSILGVLFSQLLITENKIVCAVTDKTALSKLAEMWVGGYSYYEIYEFAKNKLKVSIKKRRKDVPIDLEDIVELCDSFFSYDCTLTLSAIAEEMNYHIGNEAFQNRFRAFQKAMKYGLSLPNEATLYEMGFNDRAVAQIINSAINGRTEAIGKKAITEAIKSDDSLKESIMVCLRDYPSYYTDKATELFSI